MDAFAANVYIYISSALNELQLEATLAANIDDVKSTHRLRFISEFLDSEQQ